ncbi:MAG: NAD-dependent epimerase/dehydratase family protein [Novosphingobium sp.]|nr:NAD-dependent epimerase/dehydratase family protein [Novosphingobium sp.]MCP5404230.1 NAD-dependent epimerase/dehydratase family protein [Novosphingobium sp.]
MKTLIVGGTGFVGGHTALYFKDLGHDVTIMSRSAPRGTSRLNDLPFVAGNYIEEQFDDGRLEGYDWLIFAAGSDMGTFPPDGSVSEAEYFEKANIEALPRFFEQAKKAGISRAVYMGSFYSFVAPENIEKIPYVRSRHLSDAAIRALSSPSFNVCSCALPWIVGYTPGLPVPHWEALTRYAQGKLEGVPEFAPPGGANFMSCRSIAEAMLGGLERGESGKSYLVGDVNLSWKQFFETWFKAAGRPRDLEVRTGHPIIPDFALTYLSFGSTDYEPPAEETAQLGYQRGVLPQEVEDCVKYYSTL